MSTLFPVRRPRRWRRTEALRALVRETQLDAGDLVLPLFVRPGRGKLAVSSMPGVFQLGLEDALQEEGARVAALGLGGVILFGLPPEKDAHGSGADDPNGVVQQAIGVLKAAFPKLLVITDVCMCEYTSHGHCGILEGEEVANDPTLLRLASAAVSHARAGADVVAPSDMMDGRVMAIRQALDLAGFEQTPILSYAVKAASAFYGPFREAADSAPAFGDRRAYQMDAANGREALLEAWLDEAEGADALMVKPALPYLDVLAKLRERTHLPLAAYQVSGEFAMIKAAAEKGWIDEKRIVMESLTALKRAGADFIISYHAADVAQWLREP